MHRCCRLGQLVIGITPLIVILSSCQASNSERTKRWNTYRNPRYGFEFPYPSHWVAFPMPDNRDGRAFRDPNNPSVEIRGWAAISLSPDSSPSFNNPRKESPNLQKQNFTTAQGVTGKLQVELGSDISSMTLTLRQGNVIYNWQGQGESQEFANRYRFFYDVAGQYRIPLAEKK